MSNLELRKAIYDVETVQKVMPQIDINLVEHFFPGLYIRQVTMPKGAKITTATHKTEHAFTVLKGSCIVYSEEGSQYIEAPFLGRTLPGTKRVLEIIEECVWATFHPTKETNKTKLAQALVSQDYQEAQKCLSQ